MLGKEEMKKSRYTSALDRGMRGPGFYDKEFLGYGGQEGVFSELARKKAWAP